MTPIEWLELRLLGVISFDSEDLRVSYKESINKAKEMEKKIVKKRINKNMNKYKCSHCLTIAQRESDKKWMKSYCVESKKYSRLILIK